MYAVSVRHEMYNMRVYLLRLHTFCVHKRASLPEIISCEYFAFSVFRFSFFPFPLFLLLFLETQLTTDLLPLARVKICSFFSVIFIEYNMSNGISIQCNLNFCLTSGIIPYANAIPDGYHSHRCIPSTSLANKRNVKYQKVFRDEIDVSK